MSESLSAESVSLSLVSDLIMKDSEIMDSSESLEGTTVVGLFVELFDFAVVCDFETTARN